MVEEKSKLSSEVSQETASPKEREAVVSLSDGKCVVKTLHISMSKTHKITMLLDLAYIGFIPAMMVWCSTSAFPTTIGRIATYAIGALTFLCAIGKTLCDFRDWEYTMNHMQEQMGTWYVEDIGIICNSLLSAGARFAAEEIAKAKVVDTSNATENQAPTPQAE